MNLSFSKTNMPLTSHFKRCANNQMMVMLFIRIVPSTNAPWKDKKGETASFYLSASVSTGQLFL